MMRSPVQQDAANRLSIRLWSAEEFSAARTIWDELLRRSDADPLFMSWDWQWRWWEHHGRSLEAKLLLVAVYRGAGLIGLAPFYVHRAHVRGVLHPRRLQLLGTAWRDPRAAFSDYLDILADRDARDWVLRGVADWLQVAPWDDLVLCCLRRGGIADRLARDYLPALAAVREVDPLTGWRAPLPASFDEFLERLAPDVRRRLFNQRRKLRNPRLRAADASDIDCDLDQLWCYAGSRWGSGGGRSASQGFYRDLARHALQAGQLRLTRLETDDGTLSVMFNVSVANCVYYLQSGFDSDASGGISPGYLHFGYAIENACSECADYFDFLGGIGRTRDYKRDLLTENVPLVTYHAVRGAFARGLYRSYDLWRRAIRHLGSSSG